MIVAFACGNKLATLLEGTPIEPDHQVEFDWRERRGGVDAQLKRAIEFLENGSLAQAS